MSAGSEDLVTRLVKQTGLSEIQIWAVVNALAAAVNESLNNGKSFDFPGVGPMVRKAPDPPGRVFVKTVRTETTRGKTSPQAVIVVDPETGTLKIPEGTVPLPDSGRTGLPPSVSIVDPLGRRRGGRFKPPGGDFR